MNEAELEKSRIDTANMLPIEIREEWLTISYKISEVSGRPLEEGFIGHDIDAYKKELGDLIAQSDALTRQSKYTGPPKSSKPALIVILIGAISFAIWVALKNA
ncbi:MAG: hypothetical protein ACI910_000791 [Oleispira sp.]|jgi:hypothetical protein